MASRTTLNAANLEALGAERLAKLLMEVSAGSATLKRRIRLELAHEASPQSAAHEVRKRLTAIANGRSRIGWRKRKDVLADLEHQRKAIVETIGASDPAEALDLLWRYLALSRGLLERTDDGSGTVTAQFEKAADDLAEIAGRLKPPPEQLAGQVFSLLSENEHGQHDRLVATLAPALGPAGLKDLKSRLTEWRSEERAEPKGERRILGYALDPSGPRPVYADEISDASRMARIDGALKSIADIEGDVDAFIAQHSALQRTIPRIAAEIATRLLAAGRPQDALHALNEVLEDARELSSQFVETEWEDAYLATLEALGRQEEAQDFRWHCFTARLDADRLKAFIAKLPDFEDVETEEAALNRVLTQEDPHDALAFFTAWPDLKRAARLVEREAGRWDGDLYEILTPASEVLETHHPLAATRLKRAMIDLTLEAAKSSRYRHAARHLSDCARLAARIDDFGDMAAHDEYLAGLKIRHGRKHGFWKRLADEAR
ncbi:hypothetical protein DYI37_17530 [Fulvimarina endophytica]|uniref:Uncharacterized protein n=1 Tax=Fulvimarina endophytica TaxID=2293836 RepID=A0A371WYI9_9HYPH|nr:DUF6880 family protein [Fulvimarina endophytica]RFC62050.1 hypothetical protein DYI37_17530 [Fulvimarina endophytica]